MSAANAKIAQKLEGIVVTMEILVDKMRSISTTSFETTMQNSKVTAVKDKLDAVEARLSELHTLMAEAAATSSDNDVVFRSGGGGGK